VKNIPCYRFAEGVGVILPDGQKITGDISWGGNWFFLISNQGPEIKAENIAALTDFTKTVRDSLHAQNITGENGAEIDHIECFAPPQPGIDADSQNFVLCPGSAYDRSPCGTGTSAKLACLAASGKLTEGERWHQASIIGSVFEGSFESISGSAKIIPIVTGQAFVTGETTIIIHPNDPFKHGIPTPSPQIGV
jgi:4-hydroxyproline epimerase